MNRLLVRVVLSIVVGICPVSNAFAGDPVPRAAFSVDDFDCRDLIPSLIEASAQSPEQSVKTILQNSSVLRAFVANDVRAECKPGNARCDSSLQTFTLEGEVSKRIDGIVKEGILHRKDSVIVDYAFAGQAFPFSEISAIKGEKGQDVYLLLKFSDHSYTAAEVQAKYGVPTDTNIFEWYSIYKYQWKNRDYSSAAVFEINPVDGAVIKVAISLKPRKRH